jgi:hypothetical protein
VEVRGDEHRAYVRAVAGVTRSTAARPWGVEQFGQVKKVLLPGQGAWRESVNKMVFDPFLLSSVTGRFPLEPIREP